jgi:hypothetical protein
MTINNVDNRLAEGDGSIGGNVNLNLSELHIGSGTTANPQADDTSGSDAHGGSGGGNLAIDISTTDFGALDAASRIADNSISMLAQAQSSVTDASSDAIEAVKDIAETATRDEAASTSRMLILVGGAVAIGFFILLKRRR